MSFRAFILGAVAAFATLRVVSRLRLSGLFALSFPPPVPQRALPKVTPDCSVPATPASAVPAFGSITGGAFSANQIIIPQGTQILLRSSLTLVATNLLQVDGIITMDPNNAPFGRPINITLISLNGSVKIGPQGIVGSNGTAAPSGPAMIAANPIAIASTLPGTNGGYVKIVAQNGAIQIEGGALGFWGGDGGQATATGMEAAAVGGQGGFGGDTRLCALDGIFIGPNGLVTGGVGGRGGNATATTGNGKEAHAEGGPAADGGDVYIDGLVAGMQVTNAGTIHGGGADWGGDGIATGGPGAGMLSRIGGDATAQGGRGGKGGTVRFNNCAVDQPFGPIGSFVGGDGGNATATGGPGFVQGGWGFDGGDATATGGNGGAAGAVPQIPVQGGGVVQGAVIGAGGGSTGAGGNARATPGPGGTGAPAPAVGPLPFGGGSSGTGSATGGTGASGAAPTPATSGPVAPTGAAGGVAPAAISNGTP